MTDETKIEWLAQHAYARWASDNEPQSFPAPHIVEHTAFMAGYRIAAVARPAPSVSAAPEGGMCSNDTIAALIPLIRDKLLRLGWALVPALPTDAMLHAAQEAFPRSAPFVFPKLWRAMLAAAPTPPAESPEVTTT